MTHLCTIITFPEHRARKIEPVDPNTITRLGDCEDAAEEVRHGVEIEAENVRHGHRLVPSGPILSGRALASALRMILALVDLRGNPESDRALTHAARQWLQARNGGPSR